MRTLFNCKGQSIVEIALITPLVLIALYVPFDFGITMFTGHITQTAVRDGARIVSATDSLDNSTAAALATQVYNNLPRMLVTGAPATKQVTVIYRAGNTPAGCAENVEVTAQGTYNFFFYRMARFLGFTVPTGIKISRTTKMRYERQPDTNGGTGATTVFCTPTTASGTH
jgi:Flp pilus assembly protein TadG